MAACLRALAAPPAAAAKPPAGVRPEDRLAWALRSILATESRTSPRLLFSDRSELRTFRDSRSEKSASAGLRPNAAALDFSEAARAHNTAGQPATQVLLRG